MLYFGVPQGSVLSSVLFMLYTQPFFDLVSKHEVSHHAFADDNQLYTNSTPDAIDKSLETLQNCTTDDWKAKRTTDPGSSPWCGKGFFSQSQLPVLTFLWSPNSPRVQSHASTSVRPLKIPNTGTHTIVYTNETTAHTDRNGWRWSRGCCALPR